MFSADDRILIYPVDRANLPLIKSAENYPNVHLCHLVSPKSWGYDGELYKCLNELVYVSSNYESALEDCNTLWIVNSWNKLDFSQFIEPAVRLAAKKGKRIVCSRDLSEEEKVSLSDIGMIFNCYSSEKPEIGQDDRVQEIRVPIAFVMSSTEFCNQFFIETALCAELRNRGHHALLISSQKESVSFGEYTFPEFMLSNHSENKKVLAMNRYVRDIEAKHQPDVIIIGIPGAAMSYDYRYSTDFGIIAYEVSEAIKPDFAILSHPCMEYDIQFFKGVEEALHGRLGTHVDVHSLSSYALDFFDDDKALSYLSVDDSYVSEMISQAGYNNLINLNNMDGISSAIDRLVEKLSDNSSSLIT